MFSFLSALIGLGPTIAGITGKIADARIAAAQASTDQEKIHAEERVRSLEAQRDALAADPAAPFVRAAFAAPFIIYVWKLIVWDKIVLAGAGSTDDLSNNLWYLAMMIAGFYFLHWTLGRWR
jgi:hypothetical protein